MKAYEPFDAGLGEPVSVKIPAPVAALLIGVIALGAWGALVAGAAWVLSWW